MSSLLIEGMHPNELLALLTRSEYEEAILAQKSIVLHIGTARILGRFAINTTTLVVELAHIDDGGEGVLLLLKNTLVRYCRQRGLSCIEWRIHAVSCAQPNLKLRAVMEKRGFERKSIEPDGEMYYKQEIVEAQTPFAEG